MNDDAQPVKFLAGYSGWGAGQLEGELKTGSWITLPATMELIFDADDGLWERVLKAIGRTTLVEALKLKHVPEDPSVN